MAKPKPKKPVPKKSTADPIAVRAQQATDLKYGPELSALRQLGQEAQQSYLAGAGQARAAANSIVAQANASSGGLADFLKRASLRDQETFAAVRRQTNPTINNEARMAAQSAGLTAESAAAGLANAKLRAQQAGSYQQQNLYSTYRGDLGKINAQASSLAGQAGQYAQQVYQSLLDDKSKNDLAARKIAQAAKNAALQRGTQRLLAGIDQNGQVIPGSKAAQSLAIQQQNANTTATNAKTTAATKAAKDAKDAKPKGLTAAQQNKIVSEVKQLSTLVRNSIGEVQRGDVKNKAGKVLVPAGGRLTTKAMRELLADGGGPSGKPYDPDVINAAFDLAILGGLSPANVKALHAQRVQLKGRLPTVAGGAKRPPKKPLPARPGPFDFLKNLPAA